MSEDKKTVVLAFDLERMLRETPVAIRRDTVVLPRRPRELETKRIQYQELNSAQYIPSQAAEKMNKKAEYTPPY